MRSMLLGGRDLKIVKNAVFERRHYTATRNMLLLYQSRVEMFRRYLTIGGEYPYTAHVRTPLGMLGITLYSPDDVRTVNEIFCRLDYFADENDEVIVDFGSNIGVSAAYFLSRSNGVFAYLFEPLPQNVERLRSNLASFLSRYLLEEAAVGPTDGEVEFGWKRPGGMAAWARRGTT